MAQYTVKYKVENSAFPVEWVIYKSNIYVTGGNCMTLWGAKWEAYKRIKLLKKVDKANDSNDAPNQSRRS